MSDEQIAVTKGGAVLARKAWRPNFEYRAEGALVFRVSARTAPALPVAITGLDGETYTLRAVVYGAATGTADRYATLTEGAAQVDGDNVTVPRSYQDLPLADAQAAGKSYATRKFRAVRAAGTTVNGVAIVTELSAAVELREVIDLLAGTEDTLDVVTRSGAQLTIDHNTAVALHAAVVAHYRAAVAREAALHAAIDAAADLTELRAIDIETGWPD